MNISFCSFQICLVSLVLIYWDKNTFVDGLWPYTTGAPTFYLNVAEHFCGHQSNVNNMISFIYRTCGTCSDSEPDVSTELLLSYERSILVRRRYEEELTHLRSQLAQKAELLENCETDKQLRFVPVLMTFISCVAVFWIQIPWIPFRIAVFCWILIPIFVTPNPIRLQTEMFKEKYLKIFQLKN